MGGTFKSGRREFIPQTPLSMHCPHPPVKKKKGGGEVPFIITTLKYYLDFFQSKFLIASRYI